LAGDPTLSLRREEIRQRGIRAAAAVALLIVALRYIPLTADLLPFTLIENLAYDLACDHSQPAAPVDILIVAIDDTSLQPQHEGRWPWSRRTHAELIRRLKGARAIALDVILAEPEATAPGTAGEGPDAELARAIGEAGNVVLPAHRAVKMEYQRRRAEVAWGCPRPQGTAALPVVQMENLLPPVSPIAEAAAAIGYVDIAPDSDGIFRRVEPLRQGSDGRVYPHVATAVAALVTGRELPQVAAATGAGALGLGGAECPLDEHGRMLISYCGPAGTIERVSAWEVLEGRVGPERFEGRIVIVGATASGLYDNRPSPYRSAGRECPGVETNANILNTLLHSGARKPAGRSLAWALFALALGLAVGWLAWSGGEILGPLLATVLALGVALPSFFLAFTFMRSVIPYGGILLAALIPLAIAIPERLGRDKRLIRGQFAAYVSPEVLQQLTDEPELVARGVRREVTLLFADVRGSTALSEHTEPQVWVAQLNEYLAQMSEAIFEHDGYLDKFMGDGIMAAWNAFGTQPEHAIMAMKAAQEMLRRLEVLNRYWERHPQRTPLRIGIGLHCGEAIVGNVGSEQRMQYTAIGDTVNTASRLEGLTKLHGRQLLASETVAARIPPEIARLVALGEGQVRGREATVRIFGLADEEPVEASEQAAGGEAVRVV